MLDDIATVGLAAELQGCECTLNHGSRDTDPHPVVNSIVVPMGYANNGIKIKTQDLVIPVCQDCFDGMQKGSGWLLIFCINCCGSAWVYKPLSRKPWTGKLKLVDDCINCGGLPASER